MDNSGYLIIGKWIEEKRDEDEFSFNTFCLIGDVKKIRIEKL